MPCSTTAVDYESSSNGQKRASLTSITAACIPSSTPRLISTAKKDAPAMNGMITTPDNHDDGRNDDDGDDDSGGQPQRGVSVEHHQPHQQQQQRWPLEKCDQSGDDDVDTIQVCYRTCGTRLYTYVTYSMHVGVRSTIYCSISPPV